MNSTKGGNSTRGVQLYILFLFLFITQFISAQYQIDLVPRISPDKEVYQKMGYTELRITYGSPSVNGRKIWGELEAFDKVWRAGANNATTIEFSTDVEVEGQLLDAGKYAFFVIPREDQKWTAIFSKNATQWGAYSYTEEEDALRVDIKPEVSKDHQEKLIYGIDQKSYDSGYILLRWEHIQISLCIETAYLKTFIDEVERKSKQVDDNLKWVVYLQGAEHLLEIQDSLEVAHDWVNKAKKAAQKYNKLNQNWNKKYYPKDYINGHLKWIEAQLIRNKNEFHKSDLLLQEVKKSIFYQYEKATVDEATKRWYTEYQNNLKLEPNSITCIDTLIRKKNHLINFTIIKGNGTPILFESGAGDDGSVWLEIAKVIHSLTGAPIIMYDRSGFGRSTLDTTDLSIDNHGILQNLEDLEYGLKQLSFDQEIHLVAHSYGSYLTYLYSHKHPDLVKSIVAIDAVHKYHTGGWADQVIQEMEAEISEWQVSEPEMYYIMKSLPMAADLIEDVNIPKHIKVINVSPKTEVNTSDEGAIRWQKSHEEFIRIHPNIQSIIVDNSGHYVWRDQPKLIISLITQNYAAFAHSFNRKEEIMANLATYTSQN